MLYAYVQRFDMTDTVEIFLETQHGLSGDGYIMWFLQKDAD